jgi:hypothetical protein
MPVTTGMRGHGIYDHHSAPQMAAIEAVLPRLEDAVGDMALADPPGAIGLVDYGCSEGGNSIAIARGWSDWSRTTPKPMSFTISRWGHS